MLSALLALGGVAAILLLSEILWHGAKAQRPEAFRKLVHIVSGVYIAFWPLYLSFAWIQVLSLILCGIVFASKRLGLFKSIYSVERSTYGEVLFPLGVFVAAMFAQSGWIYMAAVLHLSLADGLAALVGTRYLKRFSYTICGSTKTLIGTAVFYVMSLLIIAAIMLLDPAAYGQNVVMILILLPLATTLLENISPSGTDNLLVPAVVVLILNTIRTMA